MRDVLQVLVGVLAVVGLAALFELAAEAVYQRRRRRRPPERLGRPRY